MTLCCKGLTAQPAAGHGVRGPTLTLRASGIMALLAAFCGCSASDRDLNPSGTGASGGSDAATGGGSGGSAGAGGSAGCPGVVVEGHCAYVPHTILVERPAALGACKTAGTEWELCTPDKLCLPETLSYAAAVGCDCQGGDNACGRPYNGSAHSVYVHTADPSSPYVVRSDLLPNCVGGDACTTALVSGYTTGVPLCCREHP